ncbi:15210_t:CDS:2 [Funneliformis geosporum]|uniref:15210_t:CDS:1 n=1 Tax=Funneliformis geosporum TaxID=1117311 RepID=A0A9W4WU09_9GLOM|nr:15210_t:CDS:2 [Funneliformis geosporum]
MDRKDTLLNYFDTVDDSNLTVILKAEVVKLIDNNEEIKQQTYDISFEKVINIPSSIVDQYNQVNQSAFQLSSPQKTIPRLELKSTTNDFDEIELTKNQNIEFDLIHDLHNCSIVAPPNE